MALGIISVTKIEEFVRKLFFSAETEVRNTAWYVYRTTYDNILLSTSCHAQMFLNLENDVQYANISRRCFALKEILIWYLSCPS